ncbi:MAG: PaREP1 family protein [Nitrososphaerales archaeon]
MKQLLDGSKKSFTRVTSKEAENMQRNYQRLHERYLKHGETLLSKGDYLQASEKFWVAVVEMVKFIAARRKLRLKTHGEVRKFVRDDLEQKYPNMDIYKDFMGVSMLHANFYEDDLESADVQKLSELAKTLITKLKGI